MAHKRSRQAFEADIQKHESPFVLYGTPLPPLDEQARDDGSYVPVWKQEVTDDRGRKRLHGAFTGGFSAGYFNTVGSKEGWTPSTFVSSRANRMKDSKTVAQQRAEDFMDEEDIREAEESRVLSTTDGFAGFGTEDDPIRRNAMLDLLRPAEGSVGSKLLNKMGWKEGQGIGPRVRRKADADDPSSDTHLFAPEDAPMISFIKKHDFKGLGYESEVGSKHVPARSSINIQRRTSTVSDDEAVETKNFSLDGRSKKSQKSLRGGLGVGILNDTGSDDEDPYSMGPKISYNRTLGGDKKSKKGISSIGTANPLVKKKPVFISKKLSSMQNALRKCHDGRLPLQGFVLADELDSFSTMSLTDDKYKPPEVPENWKPARAVDSASTMEYQTTSNAAKSSSHTATSRASVLGETPLPGKSVFDYLTPAARDRLVKASGKTNLPQAMGEQLVGTSSPASLPVKTSADLMPYLDPQTAQQALARSAAGGFMPYAEDLAKRQRYRIFLEISAGIRTDTEFPPRPPGSNVTSEDHQNELNEFLRAAEVFRPVTGGLGSRFTSSTSSSLASAVELGSTSNNSNPTSTEDLLSRPAQQKRIEDPAEVAAKVGMFGPLTRSILSFQPTRLVAKRFGVDYVGAGVGAGVGGAGPSNPTSSYTEMKPPDRDMSNLNRFQPAGYPSQAQDSEQDRNGTANASLDTGDEQHQTSGTQTKQRSGTAPALVSVPDPGSNQHQTSTPSAVTVDPDKNEALEQERPGQAVFRAIFGSDDEDDEDDE